jgi:hypothetical protein
MASCQVHGIRWVEHISVFTLCRLDSGLNLYSRAKNFQLTYKCSVKQKVPKVATISTLDLWPWSTNKRWPFG